MSNTNISFAKAEVEKIVKFIRNFVMEGEHVVVPVSGGIDSDIVARLCCQSLGNKYVKLCIILQSDMEEKFVKNARALANDLDIPLSEIHLESENLNLIKALEQGERGNIFCSDKLLDPAKAKCSVRSAVISSYQDKGFLIAGTTNRSEKELGFFMTFGDNLAHFKPIAHLYKSQLNEIAQILGTRREVIEQDPSSGFWSGQTDLEDLAYWIVNEGPILFARDFSEEEIQRAEEIKKHLTYEKIDRVLLMYSSRPEETMLCKQLGLPSEIIRGLIRIVEKSKILKNRNILVELPRI